MAAQMRKFVRRRLVRERLLVISVMVTLGYLGVLATIDIATSNGTKAREAGCLSQDKRWLQRRLLQTDEDLTETMDITSDYMATTQLPMATANETLEPTTAAAGGNSIYPPDVFTLYELRHGAVVFYVVGITYMFVALAIVCDEFFVPALEVISETLQISEDVAGATFMAAGGSAPELFTSLFSVFSANSDVGIGTIVGSAVFNIMFVIGMCAIVSVTALQLTWWPLFRDVSFYCISLIVLIFFFQNSEILWYEALVLFCIYIIYVVFMKYNSSVEAWIKSKISTSNRVTSIRSTDNLIDALKAYENGVQRTNNAKFRHGVLQLLIHTIDPLGEAKLHEKAVKLHAIATVKGEMIEKGAVTEGANNHHGQNGNIPVISNGVVQQNGSAKSDRNFSQQTNVTTVGSMADYPLPPADSVQLNDNVGFTYSNQTNGGVSPNNGHGISPDSSTSSRNSSQSQSAGIDESNEPLDISWPDSCRKRFTFILVAPILLPLWCTLADVRRPEKRKWYPWTFFGSILWIAAFSFLMNWWAATTGRAARIPDGVMGLTFLAAGTSIPDLITSVIVAKKGFGDMAVSSSVGSNIFDVTVGLPLPWIIYGFIYGKPYTVNSEGMVCSVVLLFGMLIIVIIMIAAFKWQLNKWLGCSMLVAYCVFITISLLIEFGVIGCNMQFLG